MNYWPFAVASLVVMLSVYCVFYDTQLWAGVLHNRKRSINK